MISPALRFPTFTMRAYAMRKVAALLLWLFASEMALAQDIDLIVPGRKPVPDSVKLDAARKTFQDVYTKERTAAKTVSQKAALARQWTILAERSADGAEAFVLWQEAAELAAQTNDAELVGKALAGLVMDYGFEVSELAVMHFSRLQQQIKTKAEAYQLASQVSPFAETALEQDRFQEGKTLSQIAASAAQKSGNELAVRLTAGRAADAKELANEFEKIQSALVMLKRSPADAAANAAVGRFHCLYKNRWELGLPMLALGNDSELQKLAEAELRAGDKSTLELADQWWKLSQNRPADSLPLQFRAVWHYERIAVGLDGLARARVAKLMSEFWTKHPELFFRREVRGSKSLTDIWQATGLQPVVTVPIHSRQRVWVTHPFDQKRPATLKRTMWLPVKPACMLVLDVASHGAPHDWLLEVRVNGQLALTKLIKGGVWESHQVDLSPYAGQEVVLELTNRTGGKRKWASEFGYWDNVAIVQR